MDFLNVIYVPEKTETTDVIRVQDYLEACSAAHAIPQSVVLRGLGNRDLDLSHRNLGNRQLLPLFHALKVPCSVYLTVCKESDIRQPITNYKFRLPGGEREVLNEIIRRL